MKTFVFILSLNLLFASHHLHLNGYILDQQNNPIENVEITIKSLDIGTTSDANGFFNLSIPNNDNYILSFSHIGYENYNHKIDSNVKKSIDVKLKYMPIEKDLLVITSNRKKTLIKDSPIITHLIDNEDIISSGSSTLEEIIKFAMPNIQSVHDNHSNDKVKIQGLDNKYVTFLIDGNKISGEFAGNTDMSLFTLNNIERIEVVKGGLSTIYGSGAMGGVLNIIKVWGPRPPRNLENISLKRKSSILNILSYRAIGHWIWLSTKKEQTIEKFGSGVMIQKVFSIQM